jgi:hypothetical protein
MWVAVIDAQLIASRAVHRAKVDVKIPVITPRPIGVERAVIFAAHSLTMLI